MREEIKRLAASRGISLPAQAPEQFEAYFHTLVETNKKLNLTRITDPVEVMIKHFCDSLELLVICENLQGALLDVGTGAGLPGIPLKIACPHLQLTLLDSSRKRVDFLSGVCQELGFTDTVIVHGRAEDFARDENYREHFDFVVSRAVARLNVLAELCLPFTAIGGSFIAYKGPDGINELQEAEHAFEQLGAVVDKQWPYQLPAGMGERSLLLIKKVSPTPAKFPRKAGIPEKRPLT